MPESTPDTGQSTSDSAGPAESADAVRRRFADVLARKKAQQRGGTAHTDAGSKVHGSGRVPKRQDFRRKTG